MEFYVIYSADAQPHYMEFCRPSEAVTAKLQLTEDGESEYAYLENGWETAVHEKWAGILTKAEFEAFLNDTYLSPEDTETMGSLTDIGWLPAISFNADDQDSICNAYVTPLIPGKGEMSEAQWERLRDAVIAHYSY